MTLFLHLYLLVFGLVLSAALTVLARGLALRTDFLDIPRENKSHRVPTPLLGGAAVYTAFTALVALHLAAFCWVPAGCLPAPLSGLAAAHRHGALGSVAKVAWILLCGGLMTALGLLDDRKILRARTKLLGQVVVASVLVASGFRLSLFVSSPLASSLLTIFWITAVVNSFNLLDNVDGLCAGIGAICAAMILIVSLHSGQFFVALFTTAFIGCLLGFLVHNFPPARIFLGDAGSLFAGYVLAVLTIITTYYHENRPDSTPVAVILPLIVLALPIFDTLSVILIRLWHRKPIYIGDRNHFSHRMLRLGMSPRQMLLFLYFISLSTGLGATLLTRLDNPGALIVLVQTAATFSIIGLLEWRASRP